MRLLLIAMLTATVSITSAEGQEIEAAQPSSPIDQINVPSSDETFDAYRVLFGVPQSITYTVQDGLAVFGDDIVLGEHFDIQRENLGAILRSLGQVQRTIPDAASDVQVGIGTIITDMRPYSAVMRGTTLWPSRNITYRIDPAIIDPSMLAEIRDAAAYWSRNTVINLTESPDGDLRFHLIPGTQWNCKAQLGYDRRDKGHVWLSQACTYGATIHEIGHALGLMHEHQRSDRGQFITVTKSAGGINFDETANYGLRPVQYALSYDMCSIMHYSERQTPLPNAQPWFINTQRGAASFAACSQRLPKDCRHLGQRCSLTPTDVEIINSLYENR